MAVGIQGVGQGKSEYDRFPTGQLAVLALCRLAEPIAFISIISYNFAMVEEIKGGDNVAFYAGLLVSAFAIAEASTAVMWGSLSDRYGRKPIILMGLAGTAVSSLLLGFAKNYWIAFFARLVGGLLNGNVGVMQTMVAEIVKNPKHEPRAYSIQPFMWSLGSILGSALGGYTAQPARFYPHHFAADGLFGQYPYLLPNLVAVGAMTVAILQAFLFLRETNPIRQYAVGDMHQQQTDEPESVRTPLLASQRRRSTAQITVRRRPSYVARSMPALTEQNFDLRKPSFASIASLKPEFNIVTIEHAIEDDDDDAASIDTSETSNPPNRVLDRKVVMWIVAIALMCYHQMAFVSAFPIFLLDSPRKVSSLDLVGGLGMTVHDVGSYMAINSCISLFIQAVLLPLFMGKLGVWRSIVSLSLFCPLVDIMIPFITILPNRAFAVYPALALQSFCTIIIYPSLLIMLKNSVSSRSALGYVNGLAISASSAARTIAPPLVGIFYSKLGSAGAWWTCSGFAALAAMELWVIRRSKEDMVETV